MSWGARSFLTHVVVYYQVWVFYNVVPLAVIGWREVMFASTLSKKKVAY